MKSKVTISLSIFLIFSFMVSACAGLVGFEDEPVTGDFGPAYSSQEHQSRTFEALWTNLKDNYIYFESAGVDWDSIRARYQERINSGLTNQEFTDLLRGLESDLPAGSLAYQSRAERIEADSGDLSSFEGIGAFVGFNEEPKPHVVLLGVIEGSPAEKAGLKAHDSIFEINGSPILLEEGLNVTERIRGPSGSSVTLNVQTPGNPERSVEVKRAKLTGTGKLEARQIPNTNYAYMLFPPIAYTKLIDDVQSNLKTFTTNKKLEGLILDLRVASFSSNWPFEDLFTMFYDGVIGEFYSRDDRQLVQVEGKGVFDSQSIPLVILVGHNTQGFPEILSGSLQMHKRATIIGATTPGSIETTSSYYLPDGSRMSVATISFVLPNGDEIGNSGVQPDVQVETGWDEIRPDSDPVVEAAIETLRSQK